MTNKNQIICSDAYEWAKSMPDKSIDHIITDYEYGTDFPFEEFKRICKGTILTFCDQRDDPMDGQWSEKAYWIKTPSTKNTKNKLSRFVEEIHIYRTWYGFDRFNSDLHWSNYTGVYTDVVEDKGFLWKKPLSLMERLVRIYTCEGELVADPYCGSGTTLEALKKHDRRFIGVDHDPKWVQLCMSRDEFRWR
jgi:DNA modification methylase